MTIFKASRYLCHNVSLGVGIREPASIRLTRQLYAVDARTKIEDGMLFGRKNSVFVEEVGYYKELYAAAGIQFFTKPLFYKNLLLIICA